VTTIAQYFKHAIQANASKNNSDVVTSFANQHKNVHSIDAFQQPHQPLLIFVLISNVLMVMHAKMELVL